MLGRRVRDESVPTVVFAREVELLSSEARHMRVALNGEVYQDGTAGVRVTEPATRFRVYAGVP